MRVGPQGRDARADVRDGVQAVLLRQLFRTRGEDVLEVGSFRREVSICRNCEGGSDIVVARSATLDIHGRIYCWRRYKSSSSALM